MTPEEAYEESLRRICEAEQTGALELDLCGWNQTTQKYSELASLNRLPPELKRLTSLQSLDLSLCWQLSGDLSPLAGLTSLQSLDLSGCEQLSGDLSPLAGLASLKSLNLSGCKQFSDLSPLASLASLQVLSLVNCLGVRRFASLESLLPTLKELYLSRCAFDDLPPEVCGENENVQGKVRAHYKDLKSGRQIDAEVKVLFLGNGRGRQNAALPAGCAI
jgi:Leucine-rich repeat (LRR) protein